MSYVDRVVKPGETVVAWSRPHWIVYLAALPPFLLAIALALAGWLGLPHSTIAVGLYLLAALFALWALVIFLGRWLARRTTEFAVTNHRVIVKRGIFSLHTVEMNVDKVESVDVDQTMLGRMLGFGTVTIHGVGARWDPIPRIADPVAFRSAITGQ